mgnify:CR=1 FL=1
MRDDLSEFAQLDQLDQDAKATAQVVYVVQLVAWFIPILWLVSAVIIFIKRQEYRDTWVASHLRWQWRTVWFGALWGCLSVLLMILPPLMWLMWAVLAIWLAYRIIRGWLRLNAMQGLYGD